MTPFIAYLKDGILSEDKNKAKYLKHKVARFFLENDKLYRRTFSAPTLKCVDPEEADYCLREVHEGIYGDHMAAKTFSYKIIRQGYYWSMIHSDAVAYVKSALNAINSAMSPKSSIKGHLLHTHRGTDKWRTTPGIGTGETPFKLAYDTEAQLPVETGSPSHRTANFDEISNIEGLKTNLELLDEVRDRVVQKMEGYKEKMKLYFGKKAKVREHGAGDLVLWHAEARTQRTKESYSPTGKDPT
ncbi:uncharacterized protein LOC141665841 [Apium graveolens]|uniref:uncharacterized protein LOC141665841 n=1 Tax=Apium graveolens TaxID=4045 RepID=UPI003D793751